MSKKKSIFKKRNISLLYAYLSSGELDNIENFFSVKEIERWFEDFKEKKLFLKSKINSHLKNGWSLTRIPLIEKTILFISTYEIIYLTDNKENAFVLFNKVIDFSKKHFDDQKFKYINAVLDSVTKEKFTL